MDINLYLWGVLGAIFAVTLGLSYAGHKQAQILLWCWAIGVAIITPLAGGRDGSVVPLLLVLAASAFYLVWRFNRKELEEARDEIRRLLAESNRRMEDERRRIARQLHDEINPRLVLAKMELQQLGAQLADIENDELRENLQATTKRLLESLGTAYTQSRDIIKQTRIEVIGSIGLVAAIESLVANYRNAFDTPRIELQHNLPNRIELPSASAVSVYRIVQEGILNTVKHANANKLLVEMKQNGRSVTVQISDDGKGIQPARSDGIGLIDMRERANLLGEGLRVERLPAGGTRITFSFSLPSPSSRT